MFAFPIPPGNCPPPPTPKPPEVRHPARPHEHNQLVTPTLDRQPKDGRQNSLEVDSDKISEEGCVTFSEELSRECYLLATRILQESEAALDPQIRNESLEEYMKNLQSEINSWQKKYGSIGSPSLSNNMKNLQTQLGQLVKGSEGSTEAQQTKQIKTLLKNMYIEVEEGLLLYQHKRKEEDNL
eukprot:TRINITY_DN3977_c0_g1_i4.p3 TRINITY_DN3977_c0_g1~~TRINITY_DN3977_c0_g1_i4.p3  ORF type:complete len:183 (-),score=37.75 TRINITY_DN3977_c0_g1_i4:365-913(-)